MAERNRVLYQSEALWVGPIAGGAQGVHPELHRIQDISHDMDITRTDVFEFGRLAALTREIIEPPTVSLDFTYLLADGSNEANMGLEVCDGDAAGGSTHWINGSFPMAASGIIADTDKQEKNYYVVTAPEFKDLNDDKDVSVADDTRSVVGFGNAAISNYSVNAAVGDFARASISAEAYNLNFQSGLASSAGYLRGEVPSINKETNKAYDGHFNLSEPTTGDLSVFALRPGDISLKFGATDGSRDQTLQVGGAVLPNTDPDDTTEDLSDGLTPMHIQSFSIEMPVTRTPLNRLGSTFPYYRAVDFPLDVTLNVSAFLADVSTGNLVDLMCNAQDKRQIDIILDFPCSHSLNDSYGANMAYRLKGAVLQSQNFASTIGDNKTVDLTFTAQMGGSTDTSNGLFISGYQNDVS